MTAAATGVEGVYNNAAAPAVREPFSLSYVELDPAVGLSLPGAYGRTDFANRGENGSADTIGRTNRFVSYNAGIQVQIGDFGATVIGDFQNYTVNSSTEGGTLSLLLGRIHADVAYGFLDDQVSIGAGARIIFVDVEGAAGGGALRMVGAGPELGSIVKPNGVPWRLGATVRAPVEASPFSLLSIPGNGTQKGFVPPDTITQPWEVEVGMAYQLGPRPLNPSWTNPHDEKHAELARRPHDEVELSTLDERLEAGRRARYLNWPREHLLMLASVVLTGPSHEAVALEGFIDQRRQLVGQQLSVSPRFAVEAEPLANQVRGRAGIYFEPSRFEDGTHRQHFTFGVDVRLFAWDVFGLVPDTTWRISGFFDVAPRYQNFGFAIGPWH